MANPPFFSIIIPIYNADKYLHECIESVLNQSFQDYELILIDDGSTDASGTICDDYQSASSNIIVIHQDNHGVAYSRLLGLSKAQGEYIFFVDADDYILEHSLDAVATFLKANLTDVVVFDFLDGCGKTSKAHDMRPNIVYSGRGKINILNIVCAGDYLNSLCRKIFRRSLIDANKELKNIPLVFGGEDLLISVPILLQATSIVYLDKIFYFYRTNDASATHTYNNQRYNNDKLVHQTLCKYLSDQFVGAEHLLRIRFLRTIISNVLKIITSTLANKQKYDDLKIISYDNYWQKFYLAEKSNLRLKDRVIYFLLYHHLLKLLIFAGRCYFKFKCYMF